MRVVKYSTQEERDKLISDASNNGEYLTKDAILLNDNFLTFDNVNNLIENLRQQKISEMNTACQNIILNTFQSNAHDGNTMESYDCQLTDQSRINGLVTTA